MLSPEFIKEQRRVLRKKLQEYRKGVPGRGIPSTSAGGMKRVAIRFVEAALSRIDAGTYGTCVDCESPIPEERLRTVPGAIRCVSCQEDH